MAGDPSLLGCTFHVTAADVTAAQRANLRWRLRQPQTWFYPLLVSALVILALLLIDPAWRALDLIEPPLVIVASYAALVGLNYALVPFGSRRTMRRQPGLSQEWMVELSEHGMRAKTPMQDITVAWGNYTAWHWDDRVVMAYHSDQLFQFLPTQSLTPAMTELFQRKLRGLPRR